MLQAFRAIGSELLPKIVHTFRAPADSPTDGGHAGLSMPPAASGAGTGGPGAGSGVGAGAGAGAGPTAATVTVLETNIFKMLRGHYAAVDGEGPDPHASARTVMEVGSGGAGASKPTGSKEPPAV